MGRLDRLGHNIGTGTGVILATTDGGATWNAQSSGSDGDLSGVAFGDATHGWVVGSGGVILATTSGGFPPAPIPPAPRAPSNTKHRPGSARRDALVTVTSTDFGAAVATGSVRFGARKCLKYVSWSARRSSCGFRPRPSAAR